MTVKRKKTTKCIIGNNASLKKKKNEKKTGKYVTNQLNRDLFLGKNVSFVVREACAAGPKII